MPRPHKLIILAAFAALYLIWGSTYLAILFAIETIPPLLMAGARFLLAGFIMYAIARGQGALKGSGASRCPPGGAASLRDRRDRLARPGRRLRGVAILLGPALHFSPDESRHPEIMRRNSKLEARNPKQF